MWSVSFEPSLSLLLLYPPPLPIVSSNNLFLHPIIQYQVSPKPKPHTILLGLPIHSSSMWCPVSRTIKRTLGIGACPLNLLLTQLSIPFGFLQLALTHLKRSDWWRLKRAVPIFPESGQHFLPHFVVSNLKVRGLCLGGLEQLGEVAGVGDVFHRWRWEYCKILVHFVSVRR